MIITKEQVSSILSMMESSDSENHYIAFKAIEGFDFSGDNMGYLIFLFKFSKYSSEEWSINAPEEYGILKSIIKDIDKPLTVSAALSYMISQKACKDSIELILERHIRDLTAMLKRVGYPMDHLNLTISLK